MRSSKLSLGECKVVLRDNSLELIPSSSSPPHEATAYKPSLSPCSVIRQVIPPMSNTDPRRDYVRNAIVDALGAPSERVCSGSDH